MNNQQYTENNNYQNNNYQQNNEASATDIEAVNKKLSDATLGSIAGHDIKAENVMIEYRQVPKTIMQIMVEFCEESENKLTQLTYQKLEEASGGEIDTSDETLGTMNKIHNKIRSLDGK